MKKKLKLHLWSILSTVLFLSSFTFFYSQLKLNNQLDPYQDADFSSSEPIIKCEPIIKSAHQQYYVDLDGRTYPNFIPLSLNKSINFTCLNIQQRIKRILAWNPFFGDWGYGMGLGRVGPFVERGCPVTNCELTSDRSLLSHSDLVLVHMRDPYDDIPKIRPHNQRWVFVLYESPVNSNDFSNLEGLFNLTSTYRLDSDFSCNKDVFEWTPSSGFDGLVDFESKKIAAAVVSNCDSLTRRLDYIREMQKFTRVDLFGSCGEPCPDRIDGSNIEADCKQVLASKYKFYLAFENSFCRDYVTEKFFLEFKFATIAVVFGAGPYEVYAPKSAFIDALDFKGPKELAEYLNYLSGNKSAYESYFSWRKHVNYRPISNNVPFCDMCVSLHLEDFFGIEPRVVQNIRDYWSMVRSCDFPKFEAIQDFNFTHFKDSLKTLV